MFLLLHNAYNLVHTSINLLCENLKFNNKNIYKYFKFKSYKINIKH